MREAIRETRRLQRDYIKSGHILFTPPTDDIDMLNFWSDWIMGRYSFPCGPSKRELRVLSLITQAAIESRKELVIVEVVRG